MPAGVSKLLTSSGASNLLGCGTYDLKGGAEIVNAAAPTGTKGLMNLGPPGSQFFAGLSGRQPPSGSIGRVPVEMFESQQDVRVGAGFLSVPVLWVFYRGFL